MCRFKTSIALLFSYLFLVNCANVKSYSRNDSKDSNSSSASSRKEHKQNESGRLEVLDSHIVEGAGSNFTPDVTGSEEEQETSVESEVDVVDLRKQASVEQSTEELGDQQDQSAQEEVAVDLPSDTIDPPETISTDDTATTDVTEEASKDNTLEGQVYMGDIAEVVSGFYNNPDYKDGFMYLYFNESTVRGAYNSKDGSFSGVYSPDTGKITGVWCEGGEKGDIAIQFVKKDGLPLFKADWKESSSDQWKTDDWNLFFQTQGPSHSEDLTQRALTHTCK